MTTPNPAAEQRLRQAVADYISAPERALKARDAEIRAVAAMGLRPFEIVAITGYSRETVRKALRPEVLAAVRQARKERAAAEPRPEEPAPTEVAELVEAPPSCR